MLAKKLTAILLAIAMVVMLAGCGDRTASSTNDTSATIDQASSKSTVPEFASTDDPKLLRYMEDSIYANLEEGFSSDADQIGRASCRERV